LHFLLITDCAVIHLVVINSSFCTICILLFWCNAETTSWTEFFSSPTLLRFVGRLGLDVPMGMDLLCLIGISLSFVAFVSRQCRSFSFFAGMWLMYLSVFHVSFSFVIFMWPVSLCCSSEHWHSIVDVW